MFLGVSRQDIVGQHSSERLPLESGEKFRIVQLFLVRLGDDVANVAPLLERVRHDLVDRFWLSVVVNPLVHRLDIAIFFPPAGLLYAARPGVGGYSPPKSRCACWPASSTASRNVRDQLFRPTTRHHAGLVHPVDPDGVERRSPAAELRVVARQRCLACYRCLLIASPSVLSVSTFCGHSIALGGIHYYNSDKHSLRGLGEIARYDDQVPTGGIARERVASHKHDPVRFRSRRYSPDGRRRGDIRSDALVVALCIFRYPRSARWPRALGFCVPGGQRPLIGQVLPLAVPGSRPSRPGNACSDTCSTESLADLDRPGGDHRRLRDRPPLGRSDERLRRTRRIARGPSAKSATTSAWMIRWSFSTPASSDSAATGLRNIMAGGSAGLPVGHRSPRGDPHSCRRGSVPRGVFGDRDGRGDRPELAR